MTTCLLMALAGAIFMAKFNPGDFPNYLVGVGIALGLMLGVVH